MIYLCNNWSVFFLGSRIELGGKTEDYQNCKEVSKWAGNIDLCL